MAEPTCFISYSWDSDAHKDWVRYLAEALVANGIKTHLDQWEAHLGIDLTTYMETCVRESNFVLLICTPRFAEKANKGQVGGGGVGYEKIIVTGLIFGGSASPKKFVPILRAGEAKESLPSYLNSKLFVDFRDDNKFQANLEQLLRHFYESPLYTRPALGPKPYFANPAATPPPPSIIVPPGPTVKSLPPIIKGKDGRERVLIPAGEFLMGSDEREDEKPPHYVYLDAFYIDRYPVTNWDYKKFVDATKYKAVPKHWTGGQIPGEKKNHPVVNVDWHDAVAYAKWAGGRLPTEAEWEKAASWDDTKKEKRHYPWGNDFDKNKCNTDQSGIGNTTGVGRYPNGASPYGVLDMAGNVWEWTSSLHYSYPYRAEDGREDMEGDEPRALRGGAWFIGNVANARCACRFHLNPVDLNDIIGFRVAESFP